MYKIDGIDGQTFQKLHDFYMPKTVITSHLWDKEQEWFSITISDYAIIKINGGDITIDLSGVLYTIDRYSYESLTVL